MGRRQVAIMEVWPSAYATTREYPTPAGAPVPPAENVEPGACRCAQCGLPIEDSSAIGECPHCGSDNFLGQRFRRSSRCRRSL